MDLAVPRETEIRLRQYEALLVKWQRAINLVSPKTLPDAWERHFLDSLQILPLLPPGPAQLYDLGSGAGFPGLVLAMARPDLAVTLIESDQKKGAFLGTVSHETKTPVTIHSERIEKATETLPAPDIITARALAPLVDLFAYITPWATANPDLVAIFPKGGGAAAEIETARARFIFDLVQTPSMTDPTGVVLVIRDLRAC
jgi:16S rRNA (guanine527-N7)-methyltransferase